MSLPEFASDDIDRAVCAVREIVGRRNADTDQDKAKIMVTLEHTVAVLLLTLYEDPRQAAYMLNESLVTGVEERLAMYNAKHGAKE